MKMRSCNRVRNKFGMTLLFLMLILTACNKKTVTETSKNTVVEPVETHNDGESVKNRAERVGLGLSSKKIDLDLTKMSATMIYSTIFDMLIMPEDYIDKNIKLKGWFETYTDPYTNELYYAVIVPDATACCQQGIEFVWPGDHTYPADFPNPGEDITVTGIYKIIESNGISYNYIEASSVEF